MNALMPLVSLILLSVATEESVETEKVTSVPPKPIPVQMCDVENACKNVVKIVIEPKYKHLRLVPGDEREFMVKLKNPNNKDVVVEPKIVSFNKNKFVLKTGKSAEVKIAVKVPKDAEKGHFRSHVYRYGIKRSEIDD